MPEAVKRQISKIYTSGLKVFLHLTFLRCELGVCNAVPTRNQESKMIIILDRHRSEIHACTFSLIHTRELRLHSWRTRGRISARFNVFLLWSNI